MCAREALRYLGGPPPFDGQPSPCSATAIPAMAVAVKGLAMQRIRDKRGREVCGTDVQDRAAVRLLGWEMPFVALTIKYI